MNWDGKKSHVDPWTVQQPDEQSCVSLPTCAACNAEAVLNEAGICADCAKAETEKGGE